jgi:hypothetical protein
VGSRKARAASPDAWRLVVALGAQGLGERVMVGDVRHAWEERLGLVVPQAAVGDGLVPGRPSLEAGVPSGSSASPTGCLSFVSAMVRPNDATRRLGEGRAAEETDAARSRAGPHGKGPPAASRAVRPPAINRSTINVGGREENPTGSEPAKIVNVSATTTEVS